MRVPLDWLNEFCDPALPIEVLEERLTMTGTKVEAVHHHGVAGTEHFVVGKVLTAERHPDADRLRVCTVDVGDGGEARQIVCGAPNVAAGQTVAVARPGAVMPDGTKLKKAKLRGQVSDGMILAEDELAIGTDHDGIMVLDETLAAGTPLAEVLPIATPVLELEITPNRPDCLGVYGVAREVHAITGAPLAQAPWAGDCGCDGDIDGSPVEVVVECPDLCPRFTGRVFEDVRIGPSPAWLKARLMAAGQRPINNVVDITNYVMLLTGQPLHAFDLDRVVGGRLVVRRAHEGETIVTLDDQERTLDGEMVVIEDDQGPTSIAGVMGGNRSEVHAGTTRVFMEAATWVGPNINRTMGRLNLRSEAGARFEKGLSVESALEAQAMASILMVEVCGARLLDGTVDVGERLGEPQMVRMRDARLAGLLGHVIPRPRASEILDSLGFAVSDSEDGVVTRVPHFRRRDVTREADLIEEVARVDGVDNLPATLPSRRGAVGVLSRGQRLRRRAEDALVGCGLHEVVGWSFTSPSVLGRLGLAQDDPRARPWPIENPMSEDQSVMRTTLLTSLLDAASYNVRRGFADLGLFEVGAVYLPPGGGGWRPAGDWDPREGSEGWIAVREERLPDERRHLAGVLLGAARPRTWTEPRPPAGDFFAAKGVVEALLGAVRVNAIFDPSQEPPPFLHPGRSADLIVRDGSGTAGWVGELHPSVAAAWDLPAVAAFELDLDALLGMSSHGAHFGSFSSFPPVRQDIAVVVDEAVPAREVVDAIGKGLQIGASIEIFDVYRGEQVGAGRKSLALRLEFRADRTLTDEEVASQREAIVAVVRDRLGGELRG